MAIILLAEGGPGTGFALDLGADDVLSIPFEPVELFARIRAQLREKAPDDRLRSEVLDAKRRELEAEAALATIVAQKDSGRRRWIVLGLVTAVALIGLGIAVRNAQLSSKSMGEVDFAVGEARLGCAHSRPASERAQKKPRGTGAGSDCSRVSRHIGRIAGAERRPAEQNIHNEWPLPVLTSTAV